MACHSPPHYILNYLGKASFKNMDLAFAFLQVLRFYGFFQETVTERPDENARYRHVSIMFHMEDGTMSMHEPKVENSGLAQGPFLKRQKVMREDGLAYLGPDDLRVGSEITLFGRSIHLTGCDRFTRWFFEQLR